ncbi:TRAP transporter small permease [Paracoccus aurantiacus]|uniref:TRAP transporter small permease protein n=1 Tax=Paracoccus aurantiacus TaxID=2599412 RepID=A0A5C6S1E9_9RHOB|nr:TRAP transporter small permease [Paracoccus aurantiacus]TXB67452.1 TRAP transporter small permease [Paracoccus aurantiacus]
MRRLARCAAEAYARAITAGACLALVLATLHIFADAVATKLFLSPINGTHQIVTFYYMVALFFLPLGYAESQGAHISADLGFSLLSRRLQRIATTANHLLLTGYVGLLCWYATVKAIQQTEVGAYETIAGGQIPLWPSRWIAVMGLLAMLAIAALKALDSILGAESDTETPA